MTNRISRKCQYLRKKNGSKRQCRRNKTKRKMNKMKGGALTWDCKCENPGKTENDTLPHPPVESAFASHMRKHRLSPEELERRQKIIEQRRAENPNLRTKIPETPAAATAAATTGAATALLVGRKIAHQALSRNSKFSRKIPNPPLNLSNERTRIPPPPPPNVSTVLQPGMIREKDDGTYQIDSLEKLPKGFEDGDIIITIDGYPASNTNINKLYGGDIGNTAVVTVKNNEGGTHAKGTRMITIQYS